MKFTVFQKNKKLIVVINKIDAILLSEENTISEILKNTKKFLELNEIDNYDVYVYSAIYYKLKRDDIPKIIISSINMRETIQQSQFILSKHLPQVLWGLQE